MGAAEAVAHTMTVSRTYAGPQLPFFTPFVFSMGAQMPEEGAKSSLCFTPSHRVAVHPELGPLQNLVTNLRGIGEPQTVVFSKIPNSADV